MPASTYSALRTAALQIRNEHADRANTAVRVGDLFASMIDTDAVALDCIDPCQSPYLAAGTGLVDDKPALLLAIAAGIAANKPVSGFGRTYGVSGNLDLPAGAWLQDIILKQLDPNNVSRRTLRGDGVSNITLVRVTVNRNGDGTGGGLETAAGIWIEGGAGHYLEEVEVYGDDMGSGLAMWNTSRFDVVRLHSHDINYSLGANPGDDRVQGFVFSGCQDFRVVDATVHDIGGDYGSGPSTQWSRNAFAGCTNFDLTNVQVYNVDQGIDLSGSDGNQNFRITGGNVRDCYSAGWKFANSAKGGVVSGATAERCDLYGFFVAGPSEAGLTVKSGDILFVGCIALDMGTGGNWLTDYRPAGFCVETSAFDATISPLGIRFIGCLAYDRRAVPKMKYGFANQVVRPADGLRLNQCIDCEVIGNMTIGAPYVGMHSAVDVSWQANDQFPTTGKVASLEIIENFTVASSLNGMVGFASGVAASFADEDDDDSGRVGVCNARTGTDTNGRAGATSRLTAIRTGGGRHRIRWDARIPTLSDGTNTFTVRLGFIDSSSGEPTNGCYFRYTHSVNGGEWQGVTRAAGVETAVDTNVAAGTGWTKFEIEINAGATAVSFYINGVNIANSSTNIPTGANLTGLGVTNIKSAGVTNRELRVDLMAYSFEPTTLL